MNNKGKMPSVLAVMLAMTLLLCQGCSIKEDRSLCPCVLSMDFTDVDPEAAGVMEMQVAGRDGFLYYDDDVAPDIEAETDGGTTRLLYKVTVPRQEISVTVVRGSDGTFIPGTGVVIPAGRECPEVYMHHSVLDASGPDGTAGDRVELHKDYCRIGIRLLSGMGEYPFLLTVEGNVNGINADRSVMHGDFSCSFVAEGEIGYVNVPRQYDDSLVLLVRDGGKVLREFALGGYIAESGYDWNAMDLEDIEVSIDYAHSLIVVDVAGWSASFEYDVVI